MWTDETRSRHDRDHLRYPSDLTDAEWNLLQPMVPAAKRGGRPRTVDMREVLNGILYILSTGCQWRQIPKDLPPRSTIYDYLDLFEWDGTLVRIHHELYVRCREQAGREASPTAAIIDTRRRAWHRPVGSRYMSFPRDIAGLVEWYCGGGACRTENEITQAILSI